MKFMVCPTIRNYLSLCLGLASLLIMASCLNDLEDVISIEERPDPALLENYEPVIRPVTGSVVAFVTDKHGDPVAGANVRLGDYNGQTDEFGHFFINDIELNARGSLVRVEEEGYFDGSRRFFPLEGSTSYVKIELIDRIFSYSFPAASGGTINLPGGAALQFSGSTIATSGGESYNGEVRIAAEWLNPALASTLDRMPGNLQGVSIFNEEVSLATYGMMAVELTGSSGEPLNLADGETARISMPLPPAALSSAPAEIPLWSFYEPLGIWVQEGIAVLQNGKYVGEVGHFSFWNCDAPFPLIEFEAQLIDADGQPLVNHQVNIVTQISYTGSGFTDAQGFVSGLIPANESLELQVLNICGEVVFTLAIGPFSDNADLGQITVPEGSGVNEVVLTGQLADCDGLPVEEGIIIVEFLGQTAYHYTDGPTFEITLTACAGLNEVVVTGIDLTDLTQSEPLVINPNTQTTVGTIEVCDQQLQNFIQLTVDDITVIYTDAMIFTDSLNSPTADTARTSIQASGGQTGGGEYYIYIGLEGPQEPGDFSQHNFIEVIYDLNQEWAFQGGSFGSFVITEFGMPGASVAGTFSGELQNSNGSVSNVSGVFDIIR
jgi:hypothetical protein